MNKPTKRIVWVLKCSFPSSTKNLKCWVYIFGLKIRSIALCNTGHDTTSTSETSASNKNPNLRKCVGRDKDRHTKDFKTANNGDVTHVIGRHK